MDITLAVGSAKTLKMRSPVALRAAAPKAVPARRIVLRRELVCSAMLIPHKVGVAR